MSKLEIPSLLSRVRVKSPCSQDWNTMRGNDQVRFCDHCAKNVHNLSEMTPEAALELVEQSEGRLCVRFIPNPDGSPHIKDDVEPLTGGFRMPNLRLAAGVLSAALTFGVIPAQAAAQPVTIQKKAEQPGASGVGTLVLKTLDDSGKPCSGVKVEIRNRRTDEKFEAVADEAGEVRFEGIPAGFYEVEQAGFKESLAAKPFLTVEVGANEIATAPLALQFVPIEGVITIESPTRIWLDHQSERKEIQDAFDKDNPETDFDEFPGSELFEASVENEIGPLQEMLARGGNPNLQNRVGDTLLMKAVENGNENAGDMVEVILDAKADVNLSNRFGVTPLMCAALQNAQLVGQFIDADANVNAADDNGRTALMYAAFDGKLDVVRLLVRSGADVNARDAKGQSVLSYALADGDLDERKKLIQLLKKAGAVE
jgi:hypothetical protein